MSRLGKSPSEKLRFAVFAAFLVLAAPGVARAQTNYENAEQALRAAAPLLRARQFAAAQQPLEAALKLAPDDEFRLRVYEALIPAYRLLPEIDKMVEAAEFIIAHSDQPAKRSLAVRGLVSFLYQRGKLDFAVERYERVLQKEAEDIVALAALAEIYERPQRNADRAKDLAERLGVVERKLAKSRAEKFEADAEGAAQLAAWHWKEAAVAWLQGNDKERALAAARKSLASGPESRSELLAFYWRQSLGDVFLEAGEPQSAIPQYEAALENTTIEGYITAVKEKLAEAKQKAGQ